MTAAAGAGPFILATLVGVPCSWPGPEEVAERLLRVDIFFSSPIVPGSLAIAARAAGVARLRSGWAGRGSKQGGGATLVIM